MRTVVLTCAALALASGCGKDPKALLAPGKPDFPPPLAGLTFGMAKAEALAAAAPAGRMIGETLYPKGYRKAQVELLFGYGSDRLEKLDISFPEGTNAADLATAAWGAPVPGQDGDKEVKIWLNPEKGIRAYFTKASYDTRLFIQQYSPLEAFLGTDGKAFAFEAKQPIIGATRAQLVAAYKLDSDRIRFPPNRCGEMNLTFDVHFDGAGTARSYETRFEGGYCDLDTEAVKQIMEAKFGKPTNLDPKDPALVYTQEPNVIALKMVAGGKWAGQGKSGIGLAVFPRPTAGKLPGVRHN
jgi:hypothetical protein